MANTELVRLYWDIGRMVCAKQAAEDWGTAVIARLAKDLRSDIPDIKGFSECNVRRMIQFYKAYQNRFEIWPRPVAERTTVDTVPAAGDILNYAKAYLPIISTDTTYIKDHFEIYHIIGDSTLEIWNVTPRLIKLKAALGEPASLEHSK